MNAELSSALKDLNLHGATTELIQDHDGVQVYRVSQGEDRYVLKVFENRVHAREIGNYSLLESLDVTTLPLLGSTTTALLLPDITEDAIFRLGNASDFDDDGTARAIARWYKTLHDAGRRNLLPSSLYDENELITLNNLSAVAEKTEAIGNPLWPMITVNFKEISDKIASIPRTLTYNDFYWTNLVVARDRESAFMLDYNLLGKGYAYADIRNVTTWLSQSASEAFLAEYGTQNINDLEVAADKVIAPLVSLIYAFVNYNFSLANHPDWVAPSLSALNSGSLLKTLEYWLAETETSNGITDMHRGI